jgi:hypothetical protein
MSDIKVRVERFLCSNSILSSVFFTFSGGNVFTEEYKLRDEIIKAQIKFTTDDIEEMKYMRDEINKYIDLFEVNREKFS